MGLFIGASGGIGLGIVGETAGGHKIYRVYGCRIGEGRLIGYSLDVVYRVVED